MEILYCCLCIGEFLNRNPFVFFTWESFPMNEVMDCTPNMFGVDNVFHFSFFDTGDNFRRRWLWLLLRGEITLMIWMK